MYDGLREDPVGPDIGCRHGCAYVILSYILNWFYLKFAFVPFLASQLGHTPPIDSTGLLLVFSPIMLPFEIIITGIGLVAMLAEWIVRTTF